MFKYYLVLGHINKTTGRFADATAYYEKAKGLMKGKGSEHDEYVTLAFIHQQLCVHASGNNIEPLKNLTPLLNDSSFGIATQVVLHQALARVYRSAADWHNAKKHFKVAIKLARDSGDVSKAMECKAELGRVYRSCGCHSKALKHQKKLLDYAIKRGDTSAIADSCGYIGFTYYSMGEQYFSDAVKYLYCKLSLCKEDLKDLAGYRWCLNNLGKAYLGLKEFDLCKKLFSESAKIAEQQGNSLGLGTAYGNLGSAWRADGDPIEAIKYHKLYLEIAEKNFDTGGVAIMQRELILDHLFLFRDEKDKEKKANFLMSSRSFAFEALRTSLEVRSRLNKDDDVLKIGSFEHNQAKIYSLLLFIMVQQQQYEAGLVLSELGRAHVLADKIKNNLNIASTFSESVLGIVGCKNEIIHSALATVLNKIGELIDGPNSHLLVYSVLENPLSPKDIKETLLYTWHVQKRAGHQDREVEVHFKQSIVNLCSTGSRGSDLDAYISDLMQGMHITAQDEGKRGKAADQPMCSLLSRDIIRRKNRAPPVECSEPVDPGTPKGDKLEWLYDLLIKPMSRYIATSSTRQNTRLFIIPHGFLFSVPFCALKSSAGYLVENFVISLSPSLYLLDIGREREAKRLSKTEDIKTLAVGNPKMPLIEIDQLPGAEQEVKKISAILKGTQMLCGESATKKAVCDSFPSFSVVHLATHAIVAASLSDHLAAAESDIKIDPYDVGDYSAKGAVILARSDTCCSGVLTSSEIEELVLGSGCELLVLSCCNTARGKITGDGVLGLSRSFMCAGVRSMIVTLWPIVDNSTAKLMEHFYRHYIVSRDAPAALQASMLCLIHDHYKPENWAAFCCIGMHH